MGILENQRILAVHGKVDGSTWRISLWDIKDEVSCDATCGGCDYNSSPQGCTSCPPGKAFRQDSSCGDSCLVANRYVDAESKCQDCDSTCATCSGPSASECLSCDPLAFRVSDGSSRCPPCTRNTCPRCPSGSLCERCLMSPGLSSCPASFGYTLSLRTEGNLKEGFYTIYAVIRPDSTALNTTDLQFFIDYGYFLIEASTIEFAGNATYSSSKRL